MAIIGTQAIKLERSPVGGDPCTYAPTIVDGEMTWPGCDEKNGLAQVFAEAKYCGNGWCESDDEQHMMGTDSDTYTPIHRPIGGNPNTWTPKVRPIGGNPNTWTPTHDIMGDNPCTWAPTIVNGKMTWPGCDEHKGLAQTDAGFFGEIESDLEDMFAQVDAEAEASAESFGDGYNGGAFGGFAQIQSGSASGSAHSDSGETDHDTGFFGRMEGDLEDLFAQTGGISVTPQEEKLGMAIGNDALGMAAANHKITPQEAQLGDAGIDLGVEALSGLASHFFSQTDAGFDFGDIEADLGGMFAQTGGITVTPQEEKLGMAVGNDALGMAAASGKITPQEAKLGDAGIDLGVEALSGLASHFFSQTEEWA